MRAAPLKGDCIVCQAPEPTRVAINAAIWPGDAMIRLANYRAEAVHVARESKVPELARCNVKTIARHVEHVEASWRDVPPGEDLRDNEAPVKTDFVSVVEQGSRLGAKAMAALEGFIDEHPEFLATMMTKEAISLAKLGLVSATAGENSRLKRNQQAIDVMAVFAASSGHLPPPPDDDLTPPVDVLRAALHAERRLLAERAGQTSPGAPTDA